MSRFRCELEADTAESARQKFLDSHRYCCDCSLFGIQADLDFSYVEIVKATIRDPHESSQAASRLLSSSR